MKLIDALPKAEMDVFEGLIKIPADDLAVSKDWLISFYGKELMETELPINDGVFNQIHDMSTDSWKSYWVTWKEREVLN